MVAALKTNNQASWQLSILWDVICYFCLFCDSDKAKDGQSMFEHVEWFCLIGVKVLTQIALVQAATLQSFFLRILFRDLSKSLLKSVSSEYTRATRSHRNCCV